MPFLAADLEALPAPSTMMASGGDNGKRPWGGPPAMMAISHHPTE
jgi:hypothetical protein